MKLKRIKKKQKIDLSKKLSKFNCFNRKDKKVMINLRKGRRTFININTR